MNGSDPGLTDRLFTAAVTVILICSAALALMHSSTFTIKNIEIRGSSFFTDGEIVAMAGLSDPVNIFRLNVRECQESLERSSKIERGVVQKVLPNSLSIEITERRGVGLLPYNGVLCEIDANGIVITDIEDPGRVALPVLTGLVPTYMASGERAQPARIVDAVRIVGQFDTEVLRLLRELNIADTANLVGYLVSGAMVVFGDSRGIPLKCSVLLSILSDSQRRGTVLTYIDVSTPEASIAR